MFEDICFTCNRPVNAGVAYCSPECALHDSPAPYMAPYTQVRAQDDAPDAFVLHNTHPDYPLPLALASPRGEKWLAGAKRTPTMLHIRKPSSLSSSSASSALSTPSAPPLTDDDDSMSDPEFLLDPRTDAVPAHSRPRAMDVRRRTSGNSTRSRAPAVHALSACSSASTSNSTHIVSSDNAVPNGNRTPSRARRPHHAYHLSVPALVDGLNRLFTADDAARPRYTERPQSFTVESDDRFRIREDEREASYATLTKLSLASKGAEIIANPKSRHSSTAATRPRSSLPAYLSLMKLSSPSLQGERSRSPPKKNLSRPQSLRNLHKTSPTVAHSHETASSATITGSFSPASDRTATASSTMTHSFNTLRASSSRGTSPTGGDRAAVPEENSGAETRNLTLCSGSSPMVIVPTPKEPAVSHQEMYLSKIRPIHTENEGGCEETPRGRTRSRSNRPRSRSHTRSLERARRAHFNGVQPPVTRDASAAFAGRGRPHVRGMGGRARRTDIEREAGLSDRFNDFDWLDSLDGIPPTAASNALIMETDAERLRGRRRTPTRA